MEGVDTRGLAGEAQLRRDFGTYSECAGEPLEGFA